MNMAKGWLDKAKKLESPNADLRPENGDISLLVIHNIACHLSSLAVPIEQLFSNCLNPEDHPYFRDIHRLKVSSHC